MNRALLTLGAGVICATASLTVPRSLFAQAELPDLLRSSRNVAEIGLTDTQQRQIDEFRQQFGDRRRLLNRTVEDLQRATQDRILGVLTQQQRERLAQLDYQNRGPSALLYPRTAEALRLTDEQTKKLQEIRKAAQDTYRKSGRDFGKISKDRDAKYLAVLTPRQRTQWDKMLGPPRKKELSLTPAQQRKLWGYLRRISPLTNRRYTAELKLTDRQRDTIRDLYRQFSNSARLKTLQQEYRARFDKAVGERQQAKVREGMADAVHKLFARGVEEIEAVLTRRQREQLEKLRARQSQLRYRSRGIQSIPSDDIAEELQLTDAQKMNLKSLRQAADEEEQKERRESRERLRLIRERRDDKYLNVLTPMQRFRWEKMIGQPLKRLKPDI